MAEPTVSETDLVPSEWSDGEPETVEEWGQRQFDCGLKTGREQGRNTAAKFLEDKAAELFLAGKDEHAAAFRELARLVKALPVA